MLALSLFLAFSRRSLKTGYLRNVSAPGSSQSHQLFLTPDLILIYTIQDFASISTNMYYNVSVLVYSYSFPCMYECVFLIILLIPSCNLLSLVVILISFAWETLLCKCRCLNFFRRYFAPVLYLVYFCKMEKKLEHLGFFTFFPHLVHTRVLRSRATRTILAIAEVDSHAFSSL